MTPLDDELRALLTSRAGAVPPPADPLAGVEARAGRLRRARWARTAAGAALAAVLVGVGVPAALGATRPGAQGGGVLAGDPTPAPAVTSAPGPTAEPSPAVSVRPRTTATLARPAGTLDWPMSDLVPATDAAVARWSTAHPGAGPVLGGVLGTLPVPGGVTARVLQLWRADVEPRVAVVTSAEPALLLRDEKAAGLPGVVRAVLPGSATPYVLVLGGPGTTRVDYAADGVRFVPRGDGRFGVFARTGPTAGTPDLVRVLDVAGRATSLPADPGGATDAGPDGAVPPLLDWPTRGDEAAGPSQDQARAAFAEALGEPGAQTGLRVLFAGADDSGRRFLLGQARLVGRATAYTIGWTTGGRDGPQLFLGPPTPARPHALAMVLCCGAGTTTDTLVVVPEPGTGQVLYAPDGGELAPVGAGQDALDGVVLVDRDPRAGADRLRLLDGDGRTTADLQVPALLCGLTGCG